MIGYAPTIELQCFTANTIRDCYPCGVGSYGAFTKTFGHTNNQICLDTLLVYIEQECRPNSDNGRVTRWGKELVKLAVLVRRLDKQHSRHVCSKANVASPVSKYFQVIV